MLTTAILLDDPPRGLPQYVTLALYEDPMKTPIEVRKQVGVLAGRRSELYAKQLLIKKQLEQVNAELIELLKVWPRAATHLRAYETTRRVYPIAKAFEILRAENLDLDDNELLEALGSADSAAISKLVGSNEVLREKLDGVATSIQTQWRVRKKKRV